MKIAPTRPSLLVSSSVPLAHLANNLTATIQLAWSVPAVELARMVSVGSANQVHSQMSRDRLVNVVSGLESIVVTVLLAAFAKMERSPMQT